MQAQAEATPTTNKKASGQYNSPGMLLDLAIKNLYGLGLRDFGFVELKKSDFFPFLKKYAGLGNEKK